MKNGKEKIRIKKFNSSQTIDDLIHIHYIKVTILDIDLVVKKLYERKKTTNLSLFDERIYIANWV